MLGTIDTPTKGNIAAMGKRITSRTSDAELADLRLHSLGFVFQTFNLLSTLTAAENVAVPMILSGRQSARERADRVHELLDSVGMTRRESHFPCMLSGGEQQRVTIARAMANRPRVLLLDEPTGDLDTRNTKIVLDLLMRLNREQGVTLVMVTHDPELKYFAHRAVYVRDGKLGDIEQISGADNERSLSQLREYLERTGIGPPAEQPGPLNGRERSGSSPTQAPALLPGGVESAVTASAPQMTGGRPMSPLQAQDEVRRPEDYNTFCPDSLDIGGGATRQRLGRQALFRQLFSAGGSDILGAAAADHPGSAFVPPDVGADPEVEMDPRAPSSDPSPHMDQQMDRAPWKEPEGGSGVLDSMRTCGDDHGDVAN